MATEQSRTVRARRDVALCSLLLTVMGARERAVAAAPTPTGAAVAPGAAANEQRIYRGSYYRRGAPASAAPLFWYERWYQEQAGQGLSTHVHHAPGGRVVLRQSALHAPDYSLLQFDSAQLQTGVRARARVLAPGRVRLERSSGGQLETVVLEHSHPLVVGPTLYGMLLRHWDQLLAGHSLVVDYLSIERLDTYAFEIRRVASDTASTTFELTAKGLLLSFLVSPLRVVFDNRMRQVLRYEGPSPVLLETGAERESFDTRIEYSERAPVFR
jgi:hypothetical protein